MGWIVAALVVLAAGIFYFWPSITAAPAVTTSEEQAAGSTSLTMNERMAGKWQSTTDAKFMREITANGVIVDRYEGDTTAGVNGEWSFASNAGGEITVPSQFKELPLVRVSWEGGVETTFFVINSIDEDTMTITDLTGQGEVTTFKKI